MQRIVAVSGYFDPIHVGHIEYLQRAKSLFPDSKLVVILNNNYQCELKKGKYFMHEDERMVILESIRYVDAVFLSIDRDKTVCKSLEYLHPDVFAKGGDRFNTEIPEADICRKLNIEMIDGLGDKIQSSSKLTGLKEIK